MTARVKVLVRSDREIDPGPRMHCPRPVEAVARADPELQRHRMVHCFDHQRTEYRLEM